MKNITHIYLKVFRPGDSLLDLASSQVSIVHYLTYSANVWRRTLDYVLAIAQMIIKRWKEKKTSSKFKEKENSRWGRE